MHLRAGQSPQAQEALEAVEKRYGSVPLEEADVVVALGGDGFMLETLHSLLGDERPVYGMNLGTVGFLMNDYQVEGLEERIREAHQSSLRPLRMDAYDSDGQGLGSRLAINDVSLLRESPQTAHIRILVDGVTRMEELIGDGVLVATAAGSTAYNASVHGPIIPIGTPALALTPISCARPRRWPGALLPAGAKVRFEVIDPEKRPVGATADNERIQAVGAVDVQQHPEIELCLLFDPGHELEERILREQFLV